MKTLESTAMKHRPLVFLDVETTGISARDGHITEIGALRVEDGVVVAKFSQLIHPGEKISPFITDLTGIDDAMLAGKPAFAAIADDFRAFLGDAIFVAHNVGFDYEFIRQEYARLKQSFKMDRLCTVKLSRRLYPEQKKHGLDHVIKRLGVDVTSRHRAYDDAEVLWKMFAYEYERDQWELFRSMQKLLVLGR